MPKPAPALPQPRIANAICVSITQALAQIAEPFRAYQEKTPHLLHHATAFAWNVNPESAAHVQYAFGIANSAVVSAYRVNVPAAQWPRMPDEAPDHVRGRRVIPLAEVTRAEWEHATRHFRIRMNNPLQYAHLEIANDRTWIALHRCR
jgi:hypothetical protein